MLVAPIMPQCDTSTTLPGLYLLVKCLLALWVGALNNYLVLQPTKLELHLNVLQGFLKNISVMSESFDHKASKITHEIPLGSITHITQFFQ